MINTNSIGYIFSKMYQLKNFAFLCMPNEHSTHYICNVCLLGSFIHYIRKEREEKGFMKYLAILHIVANSVWGGEGVFFWLCLRPRLRTGNLFLPSMFFFHHHFLAIVWLLLNPCLINPIKLLLNVFDWWVIDRREGVPESSTFFSYVIIEWNLKLHIKFCFTCDESNLCVVNFQNMTWIVANGNRSYFPSKWNSNLSSGGS